MAAGEPRPKNWDFSPIFPMTSDGLGIGGMLDQRTSVSPFNPFTIAPGMGGGGTGAGSNSGIGSPPAKRVVQTQTIHKAVPPTPQQLQAMRALPSAIFAPDPTQPGGTRVAWSNPYEQRLVPGAAGIDLAGSNPTMVAQYPPLPRPSPFPATTMDVAAMNAQSGVNPIVASAYAPTVQSSNPAVRAVSAVASTQPKRSTETTPVSKPSAPVTSTNGYVYVNGTKVGKADWAKNMSPGQQYQTAINNERATALANATKPPHQSSGGSGDWFTSARGW